MKNKVSCFIFYLIFFASLFLSSAKTYAAATCNLLRSVNAVLPAEITVPSGAPLNRPITPWISTGMSAAVRCSGSYYNASEEAIVPSVGTYSEGGRVFAIRKTSNPSIGVVVLAEGKVQTYGLWSFPYRGQWKPRSSYDGTVTFHFGIRVRLIKIGNIEPGPVNGFTVGNFFIHDHRNSSSRRYAELPLTISGTTIRSYGTCTPTISDYSVDMDIATFDTLKQVGDTSGTTPFNIELFCEGAPNVDIRFDGTTEPSVLDGTVLLNTGTSDGVGLQLKKNGNVVDVGRNIRIIDSAPDGVTQVPFTVSYYRLNRTLNPGSVNSVATFTITYP
ncbi:fimbrial protein [Vibrio antiquarius]|uniref:fimbrial protein n=1 Tax=Vibrio diabolicus TaxID=50719 RepID=UPI002ED7D5A4